MERASYCCSRRYHRRSCGCWSRTFLLSPLLSDQSSTIKLSSSLSDIACRRHHRSLLLVHFNSLLFPLRELTTFDIAFLRKRASSSSKEPPQAKYSPIGDQGEFAGPVTPYASNNGMAYDPQMSSAAPPIFATQVVPSQIQPQRRASSASTASANSKYTNGGYVPSSSLRSQSKSRV